MRSASARGSVVAKRSSGSTRWESPELAQIFSRLTRPPYPAAWSHPGGWGRIGAMYDVAIRGGTVVDGTGRPGLRADVAIVDRRIVAVGSLDDDARETIDATGRVVSPGFVDVHT